MIIDENLQFFNHIMKLGNLNIKSVSFQLEEIIILKLTLEGDDDDGDESMSLLLIEVVVGMRPDLCFSSLFIRLIFNSMSLISSTVLKSSVTWLI